MALCFSFCGKLVHLAPEHNVDIRYLIIWVRFTNLKLILDHFKIRILHTGEVNKWSYNSSLPYAFVEGTGTTLLALLSSSRHLHNCTSEQRWSMSECYYTHTHLWHTRYILTPRAYYKVHLHYQFRIMQLSAFNQRQSNFGLPNHVTRAGVQLTGKRTWQMLKRDR